MYPITLCSAQQRAPPEAALLAIAVYGQQPLTKKRRLYAQEHGS